MKLILNENEENQRTIIAPPAKARLFRRALVLTKSSDLENIDAETLDELLAFVCEAFHGQVTIDDLYDGLPSEELVPTIADAIQHVVGKTDAGEEHKKK